eukprot:scaffold653_cov379-Prasinococcus_capsulatus_cf.AAC.10
MLPRPALDNPGDCCPTYEAYCSGVGPSPFDDLKVVTKDDDGWASPGGEEPATIGSLSTKDASGSCKGICGQLIMGQSVDCYCADFCTAYDVCCEDYTTECAPVMVASVKTG